VTLHDIFMHVCVRLFYDVSVTDYCISTLTIQNPITCTDGDVQIVTATTTVIVIIL
jgi:hypothetical protein